MARYAVSFEIHSDSTYTERYRSLINQIFKAPGTNIWTETTSFALVETTESLSQFADRLYFSSEILDNKDKLLVIDHRASHALARGPFEYPATLRGHFLRFERK